MKQLNTTTNSKYLTKIIHMHKLNHLFKLEKSQILKWNYENVVVACLSSNEAHKPPRDPQDKFPLLKINKSTNRNYQESFKNSPENLHSTK